MVRAWWVDLGQQKATPTRNTHAYQLLSTIFNTALSDKSVIVNAEYADWIRELVVRGG